MENEEETLGIREWRGTPNSAGNNSTVADSYEEEDLQADRHGVHDTMNPDNGVAKQQPAASI